jgi:hypothetical protein
MPSGSESQPVAWSKREEAPKTTRSIARLMGDLAARGRLSQGLRPAANRSRRPSQRTGTDRNPDEEVKIALLDETSGCLRLPLLLSRGLPPRRLPLGRRLLGGGLLCGPPLCWHGLTSSQDWSRRHALQASTFPLAHSSPYPIAFVPSQGIVEAFDANGALRAYPFGLARRPSLFGEEDLWVEVSASRSVLPWNEMVHSGSPPKLHSCNSGPLRTRNASPGPNFFRSGSFSSSPPEIVVASPATCKPRRALFRQSAWLTILVSLLDEIAKKTPSFPQVTHM